MIYSFASRILTPGLIEFPRHFDDGSSIFHAFEFDGSLWVEKGVKFKVWDSENFTVLSIPGMSAHRSVIPSGSLYYFTAFSDSGVDHVGLSEFLLGYVILANKHGLTVGPREKFWIRENFKKG
jgi:hypothetical protein